MELKEKILSIVVLPVCYLYTLIYFENYSTYRIIFGIFVLAFLVMGEIMFWERKRSWESIAMMIMTIIGGVSVCFAIGEVWDEGLKIFFTHLFGVYWIMCRSGRLAEQETSHLLAWDGITGFFVIPFKNWPLQVKTIISIFKTDKERKSSGKKTTLIVLLASLVGLILFFIAMGFLRNADAGFDAMMGKIVDFLKIDFDDLLPLKLFMTILFATWIYALLGGCYRETEEQVGHRGDMLKRFVAKLNKVPDLVWIIFIILFSIFYVIFFAMQGNYLFSAFVMKLPQEYTYSEYARSGFGDMCGVMVINFILFWLATRTSVTNGKAIKIAGTLLNVESMLLALIAFMKIMMYINAYGFTPLRLQSIWAATIMFIACICVLINLLSGKKTLRIWFYIGSASLAVLCLI